MSDEEKVEEAEVEKVDESELVPDPGPPATSPVPRPLSEEEVEEQRKAKEEAEDAARKAAEEQPEDASVEAKARNPVLVNKEQFESEWPTVQHQFPGIEPAFGKEEDGYVELTNVQAPAMAYATHAAPPVEILGKPERTRHGWDDYVDNSLPPKDKEEGDIEATPKRRPQQKVTTTSKS
jgi:hypothetical protein